MRILHALTLVLMIITPFRVYSEHTQDIEYNRTGDLQTDDCYISFIANSSGENFVLKQIKNISPDEQFLLVLDTLGCRIAEGSEIPMNKVRIIPPGTLFPGKILPQFPATLHTLAPGLPTSKECMYQDIDVHQHMRKENSPMWHQWGPLTPEKTGLTLTVIKNMATHKDLPKIVALDTFLGNADRSPPNLFYDAGNDSFCGIDLAAAFSSELAREACRQIRSFREHGIVLTEDEKRALVDYTMQLIELLDRFPPDKQAILLYEYAKLAGFEEGGSLYNQDIEERIHFHNKCIQSNCKHCLELIQLLDDYYSSS